MENNEIYIPVSSDKFEAELHGSVTTRLPSGQTITIWLWPEE